MTVFSFSLRPMVILDSLFDVLWHRNQTTQSIVRSTRIQLWQLHLRTASVWRGQLSTCCRSVSSRGSNQRRDVFILVRLGIKETEPKTYPMKGYLALREGDILCVPKNSNESAKHMADLVSSDTHERSTILSLSFRSADRLVSLVALNTVRQERISEHFRKHMTTTRSFSCSQSDSKRCHLLSWNHLRWNREHVLRMQIRSIPIVQCERRSIRHYQSMHR